MSGILRLKGASSGYVELSAPDSGANTTINTGLLVYKDSANGTIIGTDLHDSVAVQGQFDSAFPSAFDTRFALQDTHDSVAVQAQIDSAAVTLTGNQTIGGIKTFSDSAVFDGNVGIGTASPAGKLHISSGTSGDAVLVIEADTDNNNEADGPYIEFRQDGGIPESAIGHINYDLGMTSIDNALVIANSVSAGGIMFRTGTSNGWTNASNYTLIDGNGRVGIGTNNPGGDLDIRKSSTGSVLSRVWNSDASGTGAAVIRIANSGNNNNGNRLEFSDANYYTATISADRTQGIIFRTSGTGTNPTTIPERMRIDANGRITTPYQPRFHAYGAGSTSQNTVVVYPSTYVNTGSHYNTSNGRFTAPVAGDYLFFWSAIGASTNDVYRFFIQKNGSRNISGTANDIHLRLDTTETGSAYAPNGSRVQMFTLAANDYVDIYFYADAGNSHYVGSDYVNFGGYLLG